MARINLSLTFLEPFRLVDWVPSSERDKNPEFLRGLSFARWHREKNQAEGENPGRPYITGTLFRSSVIKAAEQLLFLKDGEWEGISCCNGEFKGSMARHRRHRPTLVWTNRESCKNYDNACPFCLLLGRFDDKDNPDICFSNLSLPDKQAFQDPSEIGIKRILNRVDFDTGKAQDYFYIWEVEHDLCPRFEGTVKIRESIPNYNIVKDLLMSSIKFIDRLCGALCVVEFEETEGSYTYSPSPSNISDKEIKDLAERIQNILETNDALDKMHILADAVLEMRRKGPEAVSSLPLGYSREDREKNHFLWDLRNKKESLREIFEEIAKNYKNYWQELCETLGNELYIRYKNLTGGISVKKRTIGETEYQNVPKKEVSFLPSKAGYSYEWIISGKLISKTPFFFGKETKTEEQIDMQILLTKDGHYRLPRSVLRGSLRRDLRLAIGSGCDVELGSKRPCSCPVCRIMRAIAIKDTRSDDYALPPDVRKRIRINPLTGVVERGALFSMEVAPEGISFPFQLRFRGDKLPEGLKTVLAWWTESALFLGGGISTGKGRFKLEIEHALKWNLKNGLNSYLEHKGFRDKDNFDSLGQLEGLTEELKSFEAKVPFPWTALKYTISIKSPFMSGDPIEAVLDPSNTDMVTFKKHKVGASAVFAIKGESIRGVFRTAVGRNKDKLITENEHEDCNCILCRLFGNEHETGKVRFEDLELVSEPSKKRLDHVAIDRFTGGAKGQAKFDDTPLIGSPQKPLVFRGILWVKNDLDKEEKDTLKEAFLDIKSGYYPLGGKKGIGYGWIRGLTIEDVPEWLKLEAKNTTESKGAEKNISIPFNKPNLNPKAIYWPHYFLPFASCVHRENEPITKEKFKPELYTGKLICSLKTITPLIIPDTSDEDGFKLQKQHPGHKNYRFFTLNNEISIPGSELRAMVSSVYEAITNSCLRVFEETKCLSWRMEAEEAPKFKPGRVVIDQGTLKIKEMQPIRFPVYDRGLTGKELIKWFSPRTEERPYYDHPTQSDKTINLLAEFNRNFVRNEGTENLSKEIRAFWIIKNRRKAKEKDSFLFLATPMINNTHRNFVDRCFCKDAYLKFTGPNVIEVKKIEEKGINYPEIPKNWSETLHNQVILKEVTVQSSTRGKCKRKRLVPQFICADEKYIYAMTKRCERIFIPTGKSPISINPSAIKRFGQLIKEYRENAKHYNTPEVFQTRLSNDPENPLNESDLVYFREENGKVVEIIPVSISRHVDDEPIAKKLPGDLRPCVRECLIEDCRKQIKYIPEKLLFAIHPEGLCPACCLFGTTTYQGRVRFGFAYLNDKAKWLNSGNHITLSLLERPRPTWSMPDKNSTVPGRKFYVHHNGWRDAIDKPRDKNNCSVQVLDAQNEFSFEVFFENLTDWELGLLLYCLELEPHLAHKLGMGKPLGFGSVKIKVKDIIKREKPGEESIITGQKVQFLERGWEQLKAWFGKDNKPWHEIKHIEGLRKLLWWSDKEIKVKYPKLRKDKEEEKEPSYTELKDPKKGGLDVKKRRKILTTPWEPWYKDEN